MANNSDYTIKRLHALVRARPRLIFCRKSDKHLDRPRKQYQASPSHTSVWHLVNRSRGHYLHVGTMAPAKPPKQSKQSHQEACAQTVSDLFPDICLDYLSKVAAPLNFIPARVIDKLIEDQEAGNSYVKKSRTQTRKRKRNEDDGLDDDDDDSHQNSSDEEVAQAKQKYGGGNRPPVSRSSEEIKFV